MGSTTDGHEAGATFARAHQQGRYGELIRAFMTGPQSTQMDVAGWGIEKDGNVIMELVNSDPWDHAFLMSAHGTYRELGQ